MTITIFCGPSIGFDAASSLLPEARIQGPAVCGDVYLAWRTGASLIGLVDGYFDHRLSVWHKEILWVLSQGIPVYGAASMGALRAVELERYGARGVGQVFEQFRSNELINDDEVAVAHEPEEYGFKTRSDALVNLRATLATAVRMGALGSSSSAKLIAWLEKRHYSERSLRALLALQKDAGLSTNESAQFARWAKEHGVVNQKHLDAVAMLKRIRADLLNGVSAQPKFPFVATDAWVKLREDLENKLRGSAGAIPENPIETPRATAWNPAPRAPFSAKLRKTFERIPREQSLRVQIEASERTLALLLAQKDRATVAADEAQAASEVFRRERGLLSQEQMEEWLSTNDLDVVSFSELIYDGILVDRYRDQARALADLGLAQVLRMTGLYAT